MKGLSLVDYLSLKLGLEYVSDLHFLKDSQKEKLRYLLEYKINEEDVPSSGWIDACEYISGKKCGTGGQARKELMEFLDAERMERMM